MTQDSLFWWSKEIPSFLFHQWSGWLDSGNSDKWITTADNSCSKMLWKETSLIQNCCHNSITTELVGYLFVHYKHQHCNEKRKSTMLVLMLENNSEAFGTKPKKINCKGDGMIDSLQGCMKPFNEISLALSTLAWFSSGVWMKRNFNIHWVFLKAKSSDSHKIVAFTIFPPSNKYYQFFPPEILRTFLPKEKTWYSDR